MHLALCLQRPNKTLVPQLHAGTDALLRQKKHVVPTGSACVFQHWVMGVLFVTSQRDNFQNLKSTPWKAALARKVKKKRLFFFVHWPARGRYWGQKTLAGEFCIIHDAERKTWPSHGMRCANPSPLECSACCLPSGSRKIFFSSAQIDANLLRKTCATWCHATDALRATWSEGCRANLIWVKRGAQSLPISSDLINPNRVIVPDDKEVPLCADLIVRSLFHCLGGPARSSAEKEQLSIFTTAGHKGLTLMLIEGGWATGTCVGH